MRSSALLLLGLLPLVACDGVSVGKDGASVAFTGEDLPLLPPGFPIYPKGFSTQALDTVVSEAITDVSVRAAIQSVAGSICTRVATVEVCLDDLLNRAAYDRIDGALKDTVPELWDWIASLVTGQLRFYNPGPLGTGVNEQLGRIFKGRVTFTEVKVTMTVANRTEGLWAVPIRLKMYAGDGGTVAAHEGLVTATGSAVADSGSPDIAGAGGDYTVLLQPGDRATITTDNMEGLVDALNDFRGFAVDYDADIELTDIQPDSFRNWLHASKVDDDGNGVADELAGWGLVLEDFRITVSGKGEVEFPVDLPEWLDQYLVD